MSLDAPQQREKLVASLKDQIKKLQKDRDKIKTWCASKRPSIASDLLIFMAAPRDQLMPGSAICLIPSVWHVLLQGK